VFWVISIYFNIRNTLPKSGTFLLGHPVHTHTHTHCSGDKIEMGWAGYVARMGERRGVYRVLVGKPER